MKKIFAIVLLFSSVNLINAASWTEMIQQALTGQPGAVASTAPVANAPEVVAQNQAILDQVRNNVPSLIANIKFLAPKAQEIASKASDGGFFSGLTAAFNMDQATRAAFLNLVTQLGTVASGVQNLLNASDPSTKATIKDLLAQVVQIPEFKTLLEKAQNVPLIGGQLQEYLRSLTQAAQ